jgi:hypothetical protein
MHRQALWRRIGFPIKGIGAALAIWFIGMAVAAYGLDPAGVIVFAPGNTAVLTIAAADGKLVNGGYGFAIGTSDRSGFVRRLYAQGAWFVWPSLTQGCFAPDRFRR